MKQQTTLFQPSRPSAQRGNATIYVLIVVALFAALAFVLTRQGDSSESGHMSNEKALIVAGDIIAYPAQVKQAIDMMVMSGTNPSDFDFTRPGQANFLTDPVITKIFHPDGGGLILAQLPEGSTSQSSTNPPAGWYLGEFNNVGWTVSSDFDLMLTAYQVKKEVCERINLKLTGSTYIPSLNGNTIPNLMIDKENPPGIAVHSGTNADFNASACSSCFGKPAMCVSEGGSRYGFYSVILNR